MVPGGNALLGSPIPEVPLVPSAAAGMAHLDRGGSSSVFEPTAACTGIPQLSPAVVPDASPAWNPSPAAVLAAPESSLASLEAQPSREEQQQQQCPTMPSSAAAALGQALTAAAEEQLNVLEPDIEVVQPSPLSAPCKHRWHDLADQTPSGKRPCFAKSLSDQQTPYLQPPSAAVPSPMPGFLLAGALSALDQAFSAVEEAHAAVAHACPSSSPLPAPPAAPTATAAGFTKLQGTSLHPPEGALAAALAVEEAPWGFASPAAAFTSAGAAEAMDPAPPAASTIGLQRGFWEPEGASEAVGLSQHKASPARAAEAVSPAVYADLPGSFSSAKAASPYTAPRAAAAFDANLEGDFQAPVHVPSPTVAAAANPAARAAAAVAASAAATGGLSEGFALPEGGSAAALVTAAPAVVTNSPPGDPFHQHSTSICNISPVSASVLQARPGEMSESKQGPISREFISPQAAGTAAANCSQEGSPQQAGVVSPSPAGISSLDHSAYPPSASWIPGLEVTGSAVATNAISLHTVAAPEATQLQHVAAMSSSMEGSPSVAAASGECLLHSPGPALPPSRPVLASEGATPLTSGTPPPSLQPAAAPLEEHVLVPPRPVASSPSGAALQTTLSVCAGGSPAAIPAISPAAPEQSFKCSTPATAPSPDDVQHQPNPAQAQAKNSSSPTKQQQRKPQASADDDITAASAGAQPGTSHCAAAAAVPCHKGQLQDCALQALGRDGIKSYDRGIAMLPDSTPSPTPSHRVATSLQPNNSVWVPSTWPGSSHSLINPTRPSAKGADVAARSETAAEQSEAFAGSATAAKDLDQVAGPEAAAEQAEAGVVFQPAIPATSSPACKQEEQEASTAIRQPRVEPSPQGHGPSSSMVLPLLSPSLLASDAAAFKGSPLSTECTRHSLDVTYTVSPPRSAFGTVREASPSPSHPTPAKADAPPAGPPPVLDHAAAPTATAAPAPANAAAAVTLCLNHPLHPAQLSPTKVMQYANSSNKAAPVGQCKLCAALPVDSSLILAPTAAVDEAAAEETFQLPANIMAHIPQTQPPISSPAHVSRAGKEENIPAVTASAAGEAAAAGKAAVEGEAAATADVQQENHPMMLQALTLPTSLSGNTAVIQQSVHSPRHHGEDASMHPSKKFFSSSQPASGSKQQLQEQLSCQEPAETQPVQPQQQQEDAQGEQQEMQQQQQQQQQEEQLSLGQESKKQHYPAAEQLLLMPPAQTSSNSEQRAGDCPAPANTSCKSEQLLLIQAPPCATVAAASRGCKAAGGTQPCQLQERLLQLHLQTGLEDRGVLPLATDVEASPSAASAGGKVAPTTHQLDCMYSEVQEQHRRYQQEHAEEDMLQYPQYEEQQQGRLSKENKQKQEGQYQDQQLSQGQEQQQEELEERQQQEQGRNGKTQERQGLEHVRKQQQQQHQGKQEGQHDHQQLQHKDQLGQQQAAMAAEGSCRLGGSAQLDDQCLHPSGLNAEECSRQPTCPSPAVPAAAAAVGTTPHPSLSASPLPAEAAAAAEAVQTLSGGGPGKAVSQEQQIFYLPSAAAAEANLLVPAAPAAINHRSSLPGETRPLGSGGSEASVQQRSVEAFATTRQFVHTPAQLYTVNDEMQQDKQKEGLAAGEAAAREKAVLVRAAAAEDAEGMQRGPAKGVTSGACVSSTAGGACHQKLDQGQGLGLGCKAANASENPQSQLPEAAVAPAAAGAHDSSSCIDLPGVPGSCGRGVITETQAAAVADPGAGDVRGMPEMELLGQHATAGEQTAAAAEGCQAASEVNTAAAAVAGLQPMTHAGIEGKQLSSMAIDMGDVLRAAAPPAGGQLTTLTTAADAVAAAAEDQPGVTAPSASASCYFLDSKASAAGQTEAITRELDGAELTASAVPAPPLPPAAAAAATSSVEHVWTAERQHMFEARGCSSTAPAAGAVAAAEFGVALSAPSNASTAPVPLVPMAAPMHHGASGCSSQGANCATSAEVQGDQQGEEELQGLLLQVVSRWTAAGAAEAREQHLQEWKLQQQGQQGEIKSTASAPGWSPAMLAMFRVYGAAGGAMREPTCQAQ